MMLTAAQKQKYREQCLAILRHTGVVLRRENLQHAAQLTTGEEMFRQIVESEGKAVLWASDCEQLELDWSGKACLATTPQG